MRSTSTPQLISVSATFSQPERAAVCRVVKPLYQTTKHSHAQSCEPALPNHKTQSCTELWTSSTKPWHTVMHISNERQCKRLSPAFRPQYACVFDDFFIFLLLHHTCLTASCTTWVSRYQKCTRNSAIAEGPRDGSCQLKSCQLPRNSAETTCTTSPEQIEVMKLEG